MKEEYCCEITQALPGLLRVAQFLYNFLKCFLYVQHLLALTCLCFFKHIVYRMQTETETLSLLTQR
uniref:Uncharacterized protein n=1 Tax=Anguilla anguilla TaxID=7936 RepID=A0A0E9QYC0_ANGAN